MPTDSLINAQDILLNAPNLPRWGVLGASRVAEQRFMRAVILLAAPEPRVAHPGQYIAGIYSHSQARAQGIADRNGIEYATDDLQSLLARPDIQLIYVSSQPRRHAAQVKEALVAGKHVLCEAPLALSAEEAATLVQMAANRSLLLGINRTPRALPIIWTMARLLHAGAIGEPLGLAICNTAVLPHRQQTWRLTAPDGGVYLERTLFSLDAAEWLLDDRAVRVQARAGQRILGVAEAENRAVDEEAFIWLNLERNRLLATLHDALIMPHGRDYIEITGMHGTLLAQHWTGATGRSQLSLLRSGSQTELPLDLIIRAPTAMEHQDAPFVIAVSAFWAAAASQECAPLMDGVSHLDQLRTIEAIERSVRSGRVCKLRQPGFD